MRDDYRAWLAAQSYVEKTISTQLSEVQRVEQVYGALADIVARGGFPALFQELSYTTEDERRRRPNPSKIPFEGNIRNNLASYKSAAARYVKFLSETGEGAVPVAGAWLAPAGDPLGDEPGTDNQRLSLERDMQRYLRGDIARLEPGLVIIDDGAERAVASGFIDILARDASGATVVIELKAGKSDPRVIGQVLGYMGDIADEDEPEAVRGIIVAHEFDQRTRSAARAVPNLRLYSYAVSFAFRPEI